MTAGESVETRDSSPEGEDVLARRLGVRARRLIEALPRTEDELRIRLLEKSWARPHPDVVDRVVADCVARGLVGGAGHARALRDRLFNYAVWLLARAPRTERDLRRRLARPRFSNPEIVEDVVTALKRYGYVDDDDFARRYAERRATGGKSGARLLRMELRAKGVMDGEAVDRAVREAFERAPESEPIEALIERRLSRRTVVDRNDLRKLGDFLLRRGFDPETVRERLRERARSLDGGVSFEEE